MIRRVFLVGGAVLAVLIIVAGGLYYLGGRNNGAEQSFFARLANGLASFTQSVRPATTSQGPDFAFTRLDIDTTKPQAEACLAFTHFLDVSGKTHYEDYLTIDPQTRIVVRALDQRLCISGLNFNQTYTVTL